MSNLTQGQQERVRRNVSALLETVSYELQDPNADLASVHEALVDAANDIAVLMRDKVSA